MPRPMITGVAARSSATRRMPVLRGSGSFSTVGLCRWSKGQESSQRRHWMHSVGVVFRCHFDSTDVGLGASAELLAKELTRHPRVERAANLEDAVELAASLAKAGGVVLFSPAYKSFDMFKDFEDRGRRFKALVKKRHDK